MVDFFTFNGKNVLPEYLPGIPSYGQEGAPGNTGDNGSSMYYSAYALSNLDELAEANEKVKKNELLSNNPNYTSPSYAEYRKDDLILDSEGKFYILKENEHGELEISSVYSSDNEEVSSSRRTLFRDFKVKCITGLTKSASEYKYAVSNPLYNEDNTALYDTSTDKYFKLSPYTYHRTQYEINVYGNYVYFYAIPSSGDTGNYSYKFCLCLPNGETLTCHSDTNTATMFVDNRYIFGCEDFMEYRISLPDEEEQKFIKIPPAPGSNPDRLSQCAAETIERYGRTVSGIEDDQGYYFITLLASHYIEERCTAYFEATDRTTCKTYRIDLDDIFYTKSNKRIPSVIVDQDDIIGREDYVRPATINIGWDVINLTKELYTSEGFPLQVDYLMGKTKGNNTSSSGHIGLENITENLFFRAKNDESLNFNQFNEFLFAEETARNIIPADSTSPIAAEDGRTFKCYFLHNVDDSQDRYLLNYGQTALNAQTAIESYQSLSAGHTILGNYEGIGSGGNYTNIGGCANKVLRLYFRKLNSLTISVRYNLLSNGGYPDTMVYIGRPNTHLMYCAEETDKNGQILKAPGIYYLNRIIPYKYSDTSLDEYTTKLNGDQASVTIDVNAYDTIDDPNKINFVEIGVMSVKDTKESHKISDYAGSSLENYYDLTICVTSASDYDNLNDEYDKESDERDAQDIVNEQGNDSSSSQENNQQEENPDSYPEENEDHEDTFDGNYFIKGGFIAAPKIRNIN